jgi:type IV secretion system protein TrbE
VLTYEEIAKASKKASRGMNEIIQSMSLITTGLVLNKNGSLTAAFELTGVDLEGKMQSAYDGTADNQEHAFGAFDERVTLDQFVDRSRTYDYPTGEFADEISGAIDRVWQTQFTGGKQFRNRLNLFFTYTPEKSGDGIFDRAAAKVTDEGVSWLSALVASVKGYLSLSAELNYTAEEIAGLARRFEEQLGGYSSSYASGGIKRLHGEDLLGALSRRINLDQTIERVGISDAPIYLDSLLPTIVVEADPTTPFVLRVNGQKPRYMAALTVKEWPTEANAGMLDHLLTIPGEFTVHHSFRFVSSTFANEYTSKMERHHKDLAVGLKDMIRKGVFGKDPEQFDEGRLALSNEAAVARASIVGTRERFGWYHFSIVVLGDSPAEVEETLAEVRKAVARQEIVTIRESMGLMSTYAGSIPGNGDLLIRWFFFSASAFANLINLRTVTSGKLTNRHYSEQARKTMPALAAFSTQHNTPFFFNTHIDDLGHAMLIGPPGAGKSVMATFLLTMFRKYQGGKCFIFDKDWTCRIPTLLMDGQQLDLTSRDAHGHMNPYSLLSKLDIGGKIVHFEFLNRFTRYLLECLSTQPLSAESGDFELVERSLSLASKSEKKLHTLSTVASYWPPHLKARIQPWLRGQERGHYFDNDTDAFSLGDFACIEMGALLEKDSVTAMAVLDYAVHRITDSLADNSSTPTIIYIEEVWFMLKNPAFESIIENWLRVLRKKNACLWFATQSLDELAGSDISSAIINTVPTKIFLPNEEVRSDLNYALYTRSFGLNEAQVEQIQRGQRKTNYLIVQGTFSRMVWARFEPTILACLRSDNLAKKVFAKWYALKDTDIHWKANYIEDLCNENAT